LWATTVNVKAICELGCVAHTGGVCIRANVGPIYQPTGTFKTLAALQFDHSATSDVATVAGIALHIHREHAVVLLPGTKSAAVLVALEVKLPYYSHAQTCRILVPPFSKIGDNIAVEWESPVLVMCGTPTVTTTTSIGEFEYSPTLSACEAKRSWRYTQASKHTMCSNGALWPSKNLPQFENIPPLFQPELPCCHIQRSGVQCGWCNTEYLTADEYLQGCAPHFAHWF